MDVQLPPTNVLSTTSSPLGASHPLRKNSVNPRGIIKKKQDEDKTLVKPKQSKSRNGCITCKKKRLKCDETKPSCTQCQKRNVSCEGYRKDFKWKNGLQRSPGEPKLQFHNRDRPQTKVTQLSSNLDPLFKSASDAIHEHTAPVPATPTPLDGKPSSPPNLVRPPSLNFSLPQYDPSSPDLAFDLITPPISMAEELFNAGASRLRHPADSFNLTTSEMELEDFQGSLQPQSNLLSGKDQLTEPNLEEADEEIPRDLDSWHDTRVSSPPADSSSSTRSSSLVLLPSPDFNAASPEMLLRYFDQQTCGILSVKDGPTENPWRTLIWPLAQHSQALYHAISSMTAFHGAYEVPSLRVAGVAHMLKSLQSLAEDLENMQLDCALATSLALALSEGWDEKTSTGIQHLRGAKIMVNNAMIKHRDDLSARRLAAQDAVRLRFLCHTFIYLDVIARLTSIEKTPDLDFDDILSTVDQPTGDLVEVDCLMGCATTLFPIIGQVARLIQGVRISEKNSLIMVSRAMELKQQLSHWQTPSHLMYERPEDPTSEVQHAIQTAEAYRYATLLYLHQAVPEIPSDPAEVLAKKVLMLLASVPLASRTTIVQIFPLFAASCEVVTQDDRSWVVDRWAAMIARLKIGNVDSCWNVVREVWRRRDAFQADKTCRLMRRYTSRGLSTGDIVPEAHHLHRRATTSDLPSDQVELEYTIRGKLHWLGVMSEWNWEVFLG